MVVKTIIEVTAEEIAVMHKALEDYVACCCRKGEDMLSHRAQLAIQLRDQLAARIYWEE